MKRFLVSLSTCAVLLVPVLSADAQGTGPVKKPGGTITSKSMPLVGQGLTPDGVTQLLQAKGAQVTMSNQEVKGTKFTVLRAKMQADDFAYDFDVIFATYTNGIKSWYLSAPLTKNNVVLDAEKMQGLLKHNFTMAGVQTFMIDPQTGTVMIQTTRFPTTSTDQNFQSELNIYTKNIRDTHKYWGGGE